MERRLTTILAADIAGFSRLVGKDEEGVLASQRQSRASLIDPLVARYNGRVANTAGDSLLIEFPSAVEAVRCAIAIQEGMADRNANVSADARIEYRIGINVGDVVPEGEDLLGDGVNIAARLESLASPGGIVLSRTARDQVRDRLDVTLNDLGEIKVKNITRAVRAFQVLRDGERPIRASRSGKRKWHLAAIAGVALFVLIGTVGWQTGMLSRLLPGGNQSVLVLPDRPSIAVLPFANIGGDKSQAYFTDGFTKAITTNISKFEDLFVVSSFSAFKYRGSDKSLAQIARDLGVRYLLTGDVQPGKDVLRINAQLTDASNGTSLWAERYKAARADIFDLEDDLSGKIAGTLIDRIEASGRTVERTTLSAYDLVLRAAFTNINKETLLADIEKLERAVQLDPKFSRAHSRLSETYLLLWRHSLADDLDNALQRARDEGSRAIELNNNSAKSHHTLSKIYLYADRDHELALASISRALKINPNDADLMVQMAQTLGFMNRDADAIEWIEKAMRQNPLHPAWYEWNSGFVYAMAGDFERSILESKKALAVYKTSASIRRTMIFSYAKLGQWDEAKRLAAEILERTPNFRLSTHMRNSPIMDPAERKEIFDAFERAGLPK